MEGCSLHMLILPLLLVVIASNIQMVSGSGIMEIEFIKFQNLQKKDPTDRKEDPKGRRRDGKYCDDGIFGSRSSACDHYFRICVDTKTSPDDLYPCVYYNGNKTEAVENEDVIIFKTEKDADPSMKRPLRIRMPRVDTEASIKIGVYDDDSGHDDDVDYLRLDLNQGRNRIDISDPKQFNISHRTSMLVKVTFSCDTDYYGHDCHVLCRPGRHHTCDRRTGNKICEAGYSGPLCETKGTSGNRPNPYPSDNNRPPSSDVIDCDVIRNKGLQGGTYNIELGSTRMKVPVYCDMTRNGGYTYLMYRGNGGRVSFNNHWNEYKYGFGNPDRDSEHWIGLEAMHRITNQRRYRLRVELTTTYRDTYYAEYSDFKVGDERSGYVLTVAGYTGNAGDGLAYQNRAEFSTDDHDNDGNRSKNCGREYQSGWWFSTSCQSHETNLNGLYSYSGQCPGGACIRWANLDPGSSLSQVVMKIIPY